MKVRRLLICGNGKGHHHHEEQPTQWTGRRQSSNVEDRRGFTGGTIITSGIVGVIALLIAAFLGVDPRALVPEGEPDRDRGTIPSREVDPNGDQLKQFTGVVLADTEDVWHELFQDEFSRSYREPKLVLFSGTERSGCGFASSATGPFYCPTDEKVYIDLQFFDELQNRFRAVGDFAQAYVIAHEIGHHVQKQMGVLNEVHSSRGRVSEAEFNQLSVRLELQADYLAGVWAHHAQRMKEILEPGDVAEAIKAAEAVGDDRLQKQSRGYVVPDSFT